MLELYVQEPTVKDIPNAKGLDIIEDKVKFENVKFEYNGRLMLKNLNFTVLLGITVAIVGESGGGKTTIFRLLF
jgi:ATP-binding cassette, subfamily B, vacuolar membrane transporter HMT1/ACLQ